MKCIFYIWLMLVPIGLVGQNKITVSKSDFLIGEQVTLYYEINNFEKDIALQFNPWREVITCQTLPTDSTTDSSLDSKTKELEVLFFRDTIIRQHTTQMIGAYTITAWDTGVFILPKHAYWLGDEEFFFDGIQLHVSAPFVSEDDQIMESELPFQDYETDRLYYLKKTLPWIIGSLILLILAVWYFRKRSKSRKEALISSLSPLEKALLQMEALAAKNLIDQHKVKEHYIESSLILRYYLSAQFNLNVLEKTTTQTRILLISKGLPTSLVLEIQELFNLFDSVKFAKFNPDFSESKMVLEQMKSVILQINTWSLKDD